MLAPLVLAASLLALVQAQDLIINTPSPPPATCEPTLISWGGGTPPYFIAIVNGDDRLDTLVNFGQLSNTSLTWQVVEPVGTNCLLTIKDTTGASQTSAVFTVVKGVSDSCLSGSSQSSPSSTKTSSSSGSAGSPSSTKATSTSATPTTTGSAAPTSTPASSTAPASSISSAASVSVSAPSVSPSGAAIVNSVPVAAAAAVFGAVFAALA